jgi:hypothetical protein
VSDNFGHRGTNGWYPSDKVWTALGQDVVWHGNVASDSVEERPLQGCVRPQVGQTWRTVGSFTIHVFPHQWTSIVPRGMAMYRMPGHEVSVEANLLLLVTADHEEHQSVTANVISGLGDSVKLPYDFVQYCELVG